MWHMHYYHQILRRVFESMTQVSHQLHYKVPTSYRFLPMSGRDIDLSPFATGAAVSFFVVDGQLFSPVVPHGPARVSHNQPPNDNALCCTIENNGQNIPLPAPDP